jgi:hypothetical protein
MYNPKHPRTWDESLLYVQHSYNMALHSSTGHSSFQVGLGFQPLGPIDVALPLATIQTDSSHLQSKTNKATRFIDEFNTSSNRSRRFCRNPMLSASSATINTGYCTSFRLSTNSGYIYRRGVSEGPIGSFAHFTMGLTLTNVVGSNAFELNTPPFLGLHLVFNVDLLWPYFTPLLDTLKIPEQLTPTDLNLDCMEQASNDWIVDT